MTPVHRKKPTFGALNRHVNIVFSAQQFNTYVTLKLQNVKSTTVTVKGATPCWEQDFLFETNNLDTGLLIEVWSKGMIWDRAIGYHWIPLQTIQYSNEEGTGQWRSLEAELVMRDGEVIGTKMPTGHSLLLDCRFELPFDAENIEAMDLQRKLEMLNNSMSMDQEGRLDNFRRQMIYLGHSHDNQFENDISAGYSEDSDYTSDLNYPVGQHPNSSASQFRSAAYQINTPQRSLETSRENSSERADTPNAYNQQQMLGVAQNQQHLSPDVHRRHHQQHSSTTDNYDAYRTNQKGDNSNQIQENSTDAEPLFYNSRPHNRKLNKSNYSSHETWMSCDSTVFNQGNDSFDASYFVDASDAPVTQYSKVRRPSLERQTTLYDDVNYDYSVYTSNAVNKYPSIQQNKSLDEYFDPMPYCSQDECFGQEDEDRQWDSGGYDPYVPPKPRTSKKLPSLPALQNISNKQLPSLQNVQNADAYTTLDDSSRPMSTGRRKMPQIPNKKTSCRQFSQQSQEDGYKTPESYSHRGASLPPTPTKNSRLSARLTQILEPSRPMTPGRKLPTPNPNLKSKRNKLIKRTSSADDNAETQMDNTFMRFGAISATENYNEDYNYAYQSTDNLPVAQDINVYSISSDRNIAYPQVPNSTIFPNDCYSSRTAQNCDYNQTYYDGDAYSKKGGVNNTNQLIQQNTDSLESRDDELRDSFDTALSTMSSSMNHNIKSIYAEPSLTTVLTNSATHILDIAQKNILNSLPHPGDHQIQQQPQTQFRAIETPTALPSFTVAAQVHNYNSKGNGTGNVILKQQNCVDTNYYITNQLGQLDNNKVIQKKTYLEEEEILEEYIEDETEGSISYGQNAVNQAIKLDSPLSVIHVETREDKSSNEPVILRSREPSQASVIIDPYHPAALAAIQRAQQFGTASRRSSAEHSCQSYEDPYMNYQRKNGSDAGISGRRLSVRRSPTAQDHHDEILVNEPLQDITNKITEDTGLVVAEVPEEELKEQRPQITAQQRWLWAYNKIIMQLDKKKIMQQSNVVKNTQPTLPEFFF